MICFFSLSYFAFVSIIVFSAVSLCVWFFWLLLTSKVSKLVPDKCAVNRLASVRVELKERHVKRWHTLYSAFILMWLSFISLINVTQKYCGGRLHPLSSDIKLSPRSSQIIGLSRQSNERSGNRIIFSKMISSCLGTMWSGYAKSQKNWLVSQFGQGKKRWHVLTKNEIW